jgi:hypothetical protein
MLAWYQCREGRRNGYPIMVLVVQRGGWRVLKSRDAHVDRRGWELPITVPWYSCTTNNITDYSSIMSSATTKNDYNLSFLLSHFIYKTIFYYGFLYLYL